jgi:uncharacterized DUF497 family protein
MKIIEIIWLNEIVIKLEEKHRVEQQEVQDVLMGEPMFRFVEKGHRPLENVYSAFGQTISGRYLIVYFVYKRDGRALVVSARDMTRAERRQYERR